MRRLFTPELGDELVRLYTTKKTDLGLKTIQWGRLSMIRTMQPKDIIPALLVVPVKDDGTTGPTLPGTNRTYAFRTLYLRAPASEESYSRTTVTNAEVLQEVLCEVPQLGGMPPQTGLQIIKQWPSSADWEPPEQALFDDLNWQVDIAAWTVWIETETYLF